MTQNQELQQMLLEQARALRAAGQNPLQIEKEAMRANALKGIADSMIKSAQVEVQYLKQTGGKEMPFYTEAAPSLPAPAPVAKLQEPITEHTEVKPLTQKQQQAARMDAMLLEEKPLPKGDTLEGKKPVRIDAKTTIYIAQDKNEEEAIKEWHAKHQKTY